MNTQERRSHRAASRAFQLWERESGAPGARALAEDLRLPPATYEDFHRMVQLELELIK